MIANRGPSLSFLRTMTDGNDPLNDLASRLRQSATLQEQGRSLEAWTLLEETVALAPENAAVRVALGGALLECRQPALAERHLRTALRLDPRCPETHRNLALALRDLNRSAEAEACCREALRLDPGFHLAARTLANLLQARGAFPSAAAVLQEALDRDADNVGLFSSLCPLVVAGHHALDPAVVRRFRERAARSDLRLEDFQRLHFALAQLADKEGDPDTAFEHYRRSNEARQELERRRGFVFDLAEHRRHVDELIAAFTPAWFERIRDFGSASRLPVFIVGMPRSGTTLTEQVLAAHSQVHGAGELHDVANLDLVLQRRLNPAGSDPHWRQRLDAGLARALAEGHLQRLRWLGGGATRVVDKMPFNYLRVGLIATLFPRAAVIHCRRDPVDTCLSCYQSDFAAPNPWALDLRHLGQYYREYERLMEHWAAVLPVPVFDLRYEELTADAEGISRRLLDFCGLEWEERCLRFHENRGEVRTVSNLQVRRPLYGHAVGRWRRYAAHLGPLLEELGRG